MNKYELLKEFSVFGRDLFLTGINNSHSGKISYYNRPANVLTITRSGAMLGHIQIGDMIETSLTQNNITDKNASRELIVHRAIYETSSLHCAVIHSHPPSAIALSLKTDLIMPIDAEGRYYFSSGIKVVSVENAIASSEVAEKIAPALAAGKIAVVQGHGSFAAGKSLEECFLYTTTLETICKAIINNAILSGTR